MCQQCTPLTKAITLMAQSMQDQTKAIEHQSTVMEQNTMAMQQLADSNRELVEAILADEDQYGDEQASRTLDGLM